MNFSIDNLHFFDTKLFNQQADAVIEYDWQNLVQQRKKSFPNHCFVVIEKNKPVFVETILFSYIKIQSIDKNKTIHIQLDSSLKEGDIHLYIIHLQQSEQHLQIESRGEFPVTVFHENIICQKGHLSLEINNHNHLSYYNINDNLIDKIFHQEVLINNYGINNIYYSQKSQLSKNKIDTQIYLYKNTTVNFHMLSNLQSSQLRDDSIEVIHKEENTTSNFNYFSLNSGKSVSQINSIVTPEADNSETNQSIKHILLSENGQSFSKPNLMINNMNVVASHGNSIGSFNLDNLFYLHQKGLTDDEAKKMIAYSYINHFCEQTPYYESLLNYFIGDINELY